MRKKLSRRVYLAGLAAFAGLAPTARAVRAQPVVNLRVMTLQNSPAQLQAYSEIVAAFEAKNPDLKVSIEPVAETVLWPKLAAAYAGSDVPDLIMQVEAAPIFSLQSSGLILPVTDVIKKIGESDFDENALAIYKQGSDYFAICASMNTLQNLWYRKDLFKEAQVEPPTTWEEFVPVAKSLTKGGKFGTAIPYGKTGMTSDVMWGFIYQSGGRVVTPDGNAPALNSPQTVSALEFLKEMHQYVPPGANRYDFGEVINAYVSGASATTMYTGRVFANVAKQNPSIADAISVVPYPHRKDGIAWYGNDFEGHVIPRNSKNVEAAKRFIQFSFEKDQYIKFLHTAPGHQLPPLKSIRSSNEFLSHPLLVKYKVELATLSDILTKSNCTAKPFPGEPFIAKAGEINGSNVLSEMLQRVVVNDEKPVDAAAWGHDQVAKILRT